MSDLFVGMEGAKRLLDKVEKKRLQIEANHERAARSAANVFRRYVRLEAKAIRGRGAFAGLTKTGRRRSKHLLERDVRVSRSALGFEVRDHAPHAHLVIKGTRQHTESVKKARALSFVVSGEQRFAHSIHHPGAKPNPFVHRGFLAAGKEPLIAARIVLFENGPEVTE